MQVDIVVLGLVVLLGCAALLFGVLYALGRVLGTAGRSILSVFGVRPTRTAEGRTVDLGGGRVCPRSECRKVEYRNARYCSQCGADLRGSPNRGKQ